jgi:hypothetical protein
VLRPFFSFFFVVRLPFPLALFFWSLFLWAAVFYCPFQCRFSFVSSFRIPVVLAAFCWPFRLCFCLCELLMFYVFRSFVCSLYVCLVPFAVSFVCEIHLLI